MTNSSPKTLFIFRRFIGRKKLPCYLRSPYLLGARQKAETRSLKLACKQPEMRENVISKLHMHEKERKEASTHNKVGRDEGVKGKKKRKKEKERKERRERKKSLTRRKSRRRLLKVQS